MAVYIDDTGGWGFDAQFVGVEDTAWSRDETNDIIWFSGTGTSTTGFTLPSATAWIVYEVYAVDSHTNDLTDGTNVYAWIEYTSTIGTIATTLSTWKTAWDSEASSRLYTSYKIKATHYKTGDEADVYFADEGEGFSLTGGTEEGIDGGTFTGYGAWTLGDELLADSVVGTLVNLVIDPGMDSPGDWSLLSGWSIASSTLTGTDVTGNQCKPDLTEETVEGETYRFEIDMKTKTSGAVRFYFGNFGSSFFWGPEPIHHTFDMVCPYDGADPALQGTTTFNGTFDNFTVKKV